MLKSGIFRVTTLLLLIAMLTWTSSVQLIKSKYENDLLDYDELADLSKTRYVTSMSEAVYSHQAIEKRWPVLMGGSVNPELDTRSVEPFEQPLGARNRWDFNHAYDWGDFACIDDDSAELVIGVNGREPCSCSQLDSLVSYRGGALIDAISFGDQKVVVVDIPFVEVTSFVKEAEAGNLTRYIEPNFKVSADFTPNDVDWSKQWGPRKIEADWAWNLTTGDSSVLVAIPDSGIDYTHPDLAANYVELGYDWVNNDTDPKDDAGHGTHCAGIVAGIINNNIGVAGIAQIRIMAEKMLDLWGWGSEANAAKAIVHAVDQGANIISCSWGGTEDAIVEHEAIQYAYERGVLVIASAGNRAWNLPHYPSWYNEVISVAATDSDDERASFSNWGNTIEVAAPGVNIYSTTPTYPASIGLNLDYDYLSGTSMACPHVAGVAALIWSQYPNYTNREVRMQLRRTTDDLGEHGFDVYYGYGRINSRKAVEDPIPDHDLLISDLQTPKALRPCTSGTISATIVNLGFCNETNITVQLLIDGLLSDTATIDFLTELGGSETVNFTWSQCFERTYNITSYVVPVTGETSTENNAYSQDVLVRTQRTFRVPDDYPTIQEAIDSTLSGWGDRIIVAPGMYYETVIIEQDDLIVVGEDPENTIIDGNYTIEVFNPGDPWLSLNFSVAVLGIYGANNVSVSSLTIQHGTRGITISSSCGCVSEYGSSRMPLGSSSGCTLRNITLIDNRGSFGVTGTELSHFIHDVDTSNTVDGKPIYYWINQKDVLVPEDAGYIAAVSSSNITLRNLELANNYQGALLAYATDSIIGNVTAINNTIGLELQCCSGVTVNGNIVKDSGEYLGHHFPIGIYIKESQRNLIVNNRVENRLIGARTAVGIMLRLSNDNIVFNNTSENPRYVSSNRIACGWGIWLHLSNSNRVEENRITGRGGVKRPPNWDLDIEEQGISLWESISNTVVNNTLNNLSQSGIILVSDSDYNNVTNNIVTNIEFGPGISTLFSADNCTFSENTVTDSQSGMRIASYSKYNTACGNYFFNNSGGIGITGSSCNNNVFANYFVNNTNGMTLTDKAKDSVLYDNFFFNQLFGISISEDACNNTIHNNFLEANSVGVKLMEDAGHNTFFFNSFVDNSIGVKMVNESAENVFYHNNFINNEQQVSIGATVPNNTVWDSGYPSGGNYWSDYTDVDSFKGEYQNETGSDGVWDHPYTIGEINQDRYPLTKPFGGPAGDVDGDLDVDIFDIVRIAGHYGFALPDPNYDPNCDIDSDGDIDIFDIVIAVGNYGKSW